MRAVTDHILFLERRIRISCREVSTASGLGVLRLIVFGHGLAVIDAARGTIRRA